MLARMFYRQNPVVQMFITALGLFLVFTLQIIYMQALSGTALATDSVILYSWRMIILTIIAAPPVFFILNKLLVEDA